MYFLLLGNIQFKKAILQSISLFSSLVPFTAILPLLIVVGISIIREGYEDYLRSRSDNKINYNEIQVFELDQFQKKIFSIKKWQELQVGDMIIIRKDQEIPADLIILASSDENGEVFIQTSSLDGEKTLKQKLTQDQITPQNKIEINNFQKYKFTAQLPDQFINNFEGTVYIPDQQYLLYSKNFLMKGAYLKNTLWTVGVIVYTGKDTKIMKNQENSKIKQSFVSKKANIYTAYVFLLQIIICIIFSILSQQISNKNQSYINFSNSPQQQSLINFFSILILIQTLIPISLPVSLEMIKIFQAFFLMQDQLLIANNQPIKISSFSLNEELGQVQIIFSDKTGTLTCNQMVFKNCVIGNQSYDEDENYIQKSELQSKVSSQNLQNTDKDIFHFLLTMSCCHECIIDKDSEQLSYQGMSPDEICLVNSANKIGYKFLGEYKAKTRVQINGVLQEYEILHKFKFDSDRKRMSIIIRDQGVIKIFCKGADSIIMERLKSGQDIQFINTQLYKFSCLGLRTLCLSYRIIQNSQFEEFQQKCQSLANLNDRDDQILNLAHEFENELILLGCTAIEDKLQQNVPETIKSLIKANIQIWMLTGDKLETAENIALSCNLIKPTTQIRRLTQIEDMKLDIELSKLKQEKLENLLENFVIIIEGHSIQLILRNLLLTNLFLDLVMDSESIICCRTTPKQKAQMVRLIRQHKKKITLAIGDGANDCNMIQEANIGIGIFGNEGMRAVQVSDFAIGEFQCLERLLLVHGRQQYIRIAEMINYFFYKNFVMTIIQALFQIYCGFSGQSMWDDWFISFYNMIFTAWPCIIKAVFDWDINFSRLKKVGFFYKLITFSKIQRLLPYLYYIGYNNVVFNSKSFLFQTFKGLLQALNIFFITKQLFAENYMLNNQGQTFDIWYTCIYMFTIVMNISSLNLILSIQYWTIVNVFAVSLFSYFLFVAYLIMSNFTVNNLIEVSFQALQSPIFYFGIILISGQLFLIELFIYVLAKEFNINLKETLTRLVGSSKGRKLLLNTQQNQNIELQEK